MTAQQLKQARRELGLTQAAMAKAMGIGTRKWERWELLSCLCGSEVVSVAADEAPLLLSCLCGSEG